MKKTLIVLFACLCCSFRMSAQTTETYAGAEYSCKYQTLNGRLHGKYQSFYPNGKIKAVGNFENNQRTGKWILFDSLGNKIVEKEYNGILQVAQQNFSENGSIVKNIKYSETQKKDKNGCHEYSEVKDKDVIYVRRVGRVVYPKNNEVFFENDRFWNIVKKAVVDKKAKLYKDDFIDGTKDFNATKINTLKIAGFLISDDYVYDTIRNIMENRTIGLCPLVVNDAKKDTFELGWFYYPEVRELFCQTTVLVAGINKSLDDLIRYRDFAGIIYKVDNAKNNTIKQCKKTLKEQADEAKRIEVSLIEDEHICWIWQQRGE